MSDGVHLLIPFAAAAAQGSREALKNLALPNLQRLLARMARAESDAGDEHTLSMPHERVLAREHGLTAADGQIPWAAWQVEQSGRDAGNAPWAWITPCHWRVATDHIAMANPQQLQLDAPGSQALLAAMHPYFEQDGIRLEYDAPARWLARGDIFRDLATASLDRVAGRVIDPWMPRSERAKTLRRLQQEMQMLLYTHPVNDVRISGGLLPVNSFWISGTGALPPERRAAAPSRLHVLQDLRDSALLEDWPAWAAAWQQLDAREGPRLAQALDAGQSAALTLCGERSAQTWRNAPAGLRHRIQSLFGRQPASTGLLQL